MVLKEYRVETRNEFYRALRKTCNELKEPFRIVKLSFDNNTKEFVFSIEASDNYHNKLSSYL
jgi:hypothetical protein